MAINLYSKASVDSLLSAKLSTSSLSNAATSTLNATAPTAGQALTFDGTELVWATVGGNDPVAQTWYDHPPASYTTSVANSGVAAVATVNCHNLVTSASVANSRASMFTNKTTANAGYVPQFYGNGAFAKYRLNWSKKICLFSAFNDAGNGIAANVDYWCGVGLPAGGGFVGTLTDKGMAVHVNTTAANTARIRIVYHDGTTAKTSGWVDYNSLQANNNFANNAWLLISDGAGKIELYAYSNLQNGLVVTVTDGPTGISNANHSVNIGASILTGATASANTICQFMPRVHFGV